MKYIGRLVNVGFWKESVRGTPVAVTEWTKKTAMSFQDKLEKTPDESSQGSIVSTSDYFLTKEWSEWDIEQNLGIEAIALPLLSLMGSVSSAETVWTGAYAHSFSLTDSNLHQSLTIWVKDPVVDYQFALSVIDSMTISAEVWGLVTVTMTFKGKKSEGWSQTVAYTTDYTLLAKHLNFKVAENLAWLDAADTKCLQSFEITITKNVEEQFCLWSISPEDYTNNNATIEWSFVAVYENDTDYKDVAFSDTVKALRVSMVNTDKTIWVSDNPTLVIDLAKASLTEWEKGQGNDERVTQTVTFWASKSQADDTTIDIDLINETATY